LQLHGFLHFVLEQMTLLPVLVLVKGCTVAPALTTLTAYMTVCQAELSTCPGQRKPRHHRAAVHVYITTADVDVGNRKRIQNAKMWPIIPRGFPLQQKRKKSYLTGIRHENDFRVWHHRYLVSVSSHMSGGPSVNFGGVVCLMTVTTGVAICNCLLSQSHPQPQCTQYTDATCKWTPFFNLLSRQTSFVKVQHNEWKITRVAYSKSKIAASDI